MSPNHTSLRYVRHVLAVATPTADCLASILDHLAPCLREHASGGLTATETNQMDGIRVAVEQLVGVCFQNYKNLSEDEPRGIAKQVPELQPAPALAIAVELNRILQKDPAAPEALRAFTAHLQTAARACYRRHHSVFLGDRHREQTSGSHADRQGHDGVSNARDDGHARLFAGLSQMCLGLCRELGVDHTIADAEVLPGGVRLPQIAAGVYCVEASACVSKLLSANPPPAPPGAVAIDLVDALCELQEAAVAADVSASPDAPFTTGRPETGRAPPHSGHHPPYPGASGAPAAPALDPKAIFAPHVACWIEAARETLLRACVSALGTHGVGGAAMDAAYREAHAALEGFERVVSRWPDAAVSLEEVLADADRLLLRRIGAAVDQSKQAAAGGLFRGNAPQSLNAAHDAQSLHGHGAAATRESVRFTGRHPRAAAFGHNARDFTAARSAATEDLGRRRLAAASRRRHTACARARLWRPALRRAPPPRRRAWFERGSERGSATSLGARVRGGGLRAHGARSGAHRAQGDGGVRPGARPAAGALGRRHRRRQERGGRAFRPAGAEVLGELRAQCGPPPQGGGAGGSAGPSLLEALRASATRRCWRAAAGARRAPSRGAAGGRAGALADGVASPRRYSIRRRRRALDAEEACVLEGDAEVGGPGSLPGRVARRAGRRDGAGAGARRNRRGGVAGAIRAAARAGRRCAGCGRTWARRR